MAKKNEDKQTLKPEDVLKQEEHKPECASHNKTDGVVNPCDCGFEMPQEPETGDQPAHIDTEGPKIIVPEDDGPKDVRLVSFVVGVTSLSIPVENEDVMGMLAIINTVRSGVKPASSQDYMHGDYVDVTYFATKKGHEDKALIDPRTIGAMLIGGPGSADKKQIATPNRLVGVPGGRGGPRR